MVMKGKAQAQGSLEPEAPRGHRALLLTVVNPFSYFSQSTSKDIIEELRMSRDHVDRLHTSPAQELSLLLQLKASWGMLGYGWNSKAFRVRLVGLNVSWHWDLPGVKEGQEHREG